MNVIKGLNKKIEGIIGFEWTEEKYEQINETIEILNKLGYLKTSFTYGDDLNKIKDLNYISWEDLSLHKDIDINRKEKWGMIYVK